MSAGDTFHFYLLTLVTFSCCSEDDDMVEDKSAGPFKRKRRLVLDGDMDIKIKDLYDRYVLFDARSSW